ncbi:MAG: hypothetical protein HY700_01710 [Gemmatimonadetes bacterium]|nr:hypothetical protein [Gemmatimonadota bacterium]
MRIVGQWDVADSAAQETFRRAHRALVKYDPRFSFGAWLAKIARNVALTRFEKKKITMLGIEGSSTMDTERFRLVRSTPDSRFPIPVTPHSRP